MSRDLAILHVEDDDIDACSVARALKETGSRCRLIRVANGEDALAYLRAKDAVNPDIVLLDLNMPRMNGLEFLRVVKRDLALRSIPVVVLTTTQDATEQRLSYSLGAAGFISKPADYDCFRDALKTIHHYWLLNDIPAPAARAGRIGNSRWKAQTISDKDKPHE